MLKKPIIDIQCKFCGQRCFVPLTTQAPIEIQEAYQARRVNIMATCLKGQAFDKSLIGYNIVDVWNMVRDYEIEPDRILEKGISVCS